jgi:hypothetical protein
VGSDWTYCGPSNDKGVFSQCWQQSFGTTLATTEVDDIGLELAKKLRMSRKRRPKSRSAS